MPEGDISSAIHSAVRGLALQAPPANGEGPAVTATELHEFAYRYANSYDAYLATEPGRLTFWSSDGHGVVTYIRQGRHALVGGGLLAPDAHKEQLLREFLEQVEPQGLRVVFHNIAENDLPHFRKFGFQITKWGEDPVVDLTTCTWSGKPFEWVRRQTNYCLRQGLTVVEIRPDAMSADDWSRVLAEVLEVGAESLATKPQKAEMKFYQGRLGEHPLGLRRLFIARSDEGAGRIEGFVVCNPMQNGAVWATEIYRHRTDCVRGTVAFLLHQLMLQLQSEGVRAVSLSFIPGLHCRKLQRGESFLLRRALIGVERYLSCVFDIPGVRHFKSRFRPHYDNLYVCARPKLSLGSILALLQAWGVFKLSFRKLARIIGSRLKKRSARCTLAQV
jgi:phosphatidylglycerol lysyltransferase